MAKVLKELAVAVGSYEDRTTGQTKNRYRNIGVLMESEGQDGVNRYLLLDRTFNPAGVPFKPGSDKIIISMFSPRDDNGGNGQTGGSQSGQSSGGYGEQQGGGYGQQSSGGGFDDSEIPF